jgi:hypothetical protein
VNPKSKTPLGCYYFKGESNISFVVNFCHVTTNILKYVYYVANSLFKKFTKKLFLKEWSNFAAIAYNMKGA